MHVTRIVWMGVRTPAFGSMRRLLGEVMGLQMTHDVPGVSWFEMDEGEIQVYDETDVDHTFFGSGPTIGFEVTDFREARRELVAAGIDFIGEPQHGETTMWNHFRGPDGNIYEIFGPYDSADEAGS